MYDSAAQDASVVIVILAIIIVMVIIVVVVVVVTITTTIAITITLTITVDTFQTLAPSMWIVCRNTGAYGFHVLHFCGF